jgi:RNA polymerase sigma-70 factor (ECF subfamily)
MQSYRTETASPRPPSGAPAPIAKARPAMLLIILPDLSEEDQLLASARQGNPAALTQIFDAYFKPVYGFIRLRVDDQALAEDLASDVFVKLVEAMRRRSGPRTSLRGWLFEVARNLVNDHYRGQKGFTEQTLDEWLPDSRSAEMETLAIRAASSAQTRRALQSLSPDQQEVLILRFAQNLSLQETAELMGKQVNTIKQLQFRATQALRRALAPTLLEPDHG